MAEEGFKLKLTAILSADVVGYSSLMEEMRKQLSKLLTPMRFRSGTRNPGRKYTNNIKLIIKP